MKNWRLVLGLAFAACGSRQHDHTLVQDRASARQMARLDHPAASHDIARALMKSRGIAARDAAAIVAGDAAWALAASEIVQSQDVKWVISGLMARAVLEQTRTNAEREGPIRDEELDVATQRHWVDILRPEAVRVVHALIPLPKNSDSARTNRAIELGTRIYEAASPTRLLANDQTLDEAGLEQITREFRSRSTSVPHENFQITVESVPPITADGRGLDGEQYNAVFSRAAHMLKTPGDVSKPVVSIFGVHVILMLERIPSKLLSADERKAILADEILRDRARAAERVLLKSLLETTDSVFDFAPLSLLHVAR